MYVFRVDVPARGKGHGVNSSNMRRKEGRYSRRSAFFHESFLLFGGGVRCVRETVPFRHDPAHKIWLLPRAVSARVHTRHTVGVWYPVVSESVIGSGTAQQFISYAQQVPIRLFL